MKLKISYHLKSVTYKVITVIESICFAYSQLDLKMHFVIEINLKL